MAKQIAQWTLDKKTGFRPGGVIVLCSLSRHLTLREFLHLGVVNCLGCLMECLRVICDGLASHQG